MTYKPPGYYLVRGRYCWQVWYGHPKSALLGARCVALRLSRKGAERFIREQLVLDATKPERYPADEA